MSYREDWIKVHRRDTANWLELSLAARGAHIEIARKLDDNGELRLGRRGLETLETLLRCSWFHVLQPAIQELFDAGKLIYDAQRNVLVDPQHRERQSSGTSTDRVRRHRAKMRGETGMKRDETDETHETVEEKRVEEIRSDKATAPKRADETAPDGRSDRKPRRARSKGTRIPGDWQPSATLLAWAESEGISDPLRPLEEFRDFWRSVAGQKGVKLDWDATYRNRLRQLVEAGRLTKETPLQIHRAPGREKYIPKPDEEPPHIALFREAK